LNVGLLISNKEIRNLYVLDVYMFPLLLFFRHLASFTWKSVKWTP